MYRGYGKLGEPYISTAQPLIYDESLSISQQVASIMGRVESYQQIIDKMLTEDDLDSFVIAIRQDYEQAISELHAAINTTYENSVRDNNVLQNNLERQLRDLVIGEVFVSDPISGQHISITDALNNLYESMRVNAMTWNELDAWSEGKTWNDWDTITADYVISDFDMHSRVILTD